MSKLVITSWLALSLLGCTERDDDTSTTSQPILAEIPGTVEFAFRSYGDPDLARVSYASPNWIGCGASMIGPNVALTAAHCGPKESLDPDDPDDPTQAGQLTFTTYYAADETKRDVEMFTCRRLLHGWPLHDLALLYCPPNAAGVSPGDKYGMLDFETRAPVVGDAVYSFWWNAVTSAPTGGAGVPLFSRGEIDSTTTSFWDGCLGGPAATPVGIHTTTWGLVGASGSAQLDPATHRILVGPTTLAPGMIEGPDRTAFSMRTYLDATVLENGTYTPVCPVGDYVVQHIQVNNFPPALALDPTYYPGPVDKTKNDLFDLHEDIDRRRGENTRTFHWFGFDSPRRNALWTATTAAAFDPTATPAAVELSTIQPGDIVYHTRLNLKPKTVYRVVLRLRVDSTETDHQLAVAFQRGAGGPLVSSATLDTPVAPAATFRTATLTTDDDPGTLIFAVSAWGGISGAISDLALIEADATTSFELADERLTWRRFVGLFSLGPANLLPRGIDSGATVPAVANPTPDFALRVPSKGLFTTAAVGSHYLGFDPEHEHELCFTVRADEGGPTVGDVRVVAGLSTIFQASIPLTPTWTTHCHAGILPRSQDVAVIFDLDSGRNPKDSNYLVDDVRVTVTDP